MNILLVGGDVVRPGEVVRLDVRVGAAGRVTDVAPSLRPSPEDTVYDCSGAWVGPGFVDLHTHLREPGFEYKEDIGSGSAAAAAGGYTAVVAMPNTAPAIDSPELAEGVARRGREVGLVDVVPSGTLTLDRAGRVAAPFGRMTRAGVRIFTDDGDVVASDELMGEIMERLAGLDALVSQHAMDPHLTSGGQVRAGRAADSLGLKGIPAGAEASAIRRDLELVRLTGCRYHVQHISTVEGVALVDEAKSDGLPVTAEVTPHHLAFDTDDVTDGNHKMMPPLGDPADRAALRRALRSGIIDAVATDHAPHAPFEKEGPIADAAFGVLGLEDAARVAHSEVSLDPPAFFDRLSFAPARIAGLVDHGSAIAAGRIANITVFDPDLEVTPVETRSKSRNSPYFGVTRRGSVRLTLLRGVVTHAGEGISA